MRAPRVFLVTDASFEDDVIVRVAAEVAGALPRGAFGVQLRDKARPVDSLFALATRLRDVTRTRGAWLVVNGHLDLARDVGADGVHLGASAVRVSQARAVLGARTWISVAAHDANDVERALRDGADAALVSPIFPTATHPGAAPRGVDALRDARARAPQSSLTLYALGGVDAGNARACAREGADGVAVIRALLASEDPSVEAKSLYAAFENC